jgi:hypothetical protein
MSLPSSLLAYEAQMQFMELAMDQPRGSRMYFTDYQKAEMFRFRCHQARKLHRKENESVHEPGEMLHGKSEYDILQFTIRRSPDGFWVYAEKQFLDTSRVEPIPEEDYAEPNKEIDIEGIINDNEAAT